MCFSQFSRLQAYLQLSVSCKCNFTFILKSDFKRPKQEGEIKYFMRNHALS